jgi:hypothetical protein
MVMLQAIVRGQLVRRQASLTLRRMQALVYAQRRARAERLRLLDVVEDDASRQQAASATPPRRRSPSPQHPRSWKPLVSRALWHCPSSDEEETDKCARWVALAVLPSLCCAGGGGEASRGERPDRGGGRRRAEGGRAAQQLRPLLGVDDAEPHAHAEGRAAPEGLAVTVAVGADGRERADAQRPLRRRVLHLHVGADAEPARGPAVLHGQHGVVARQGAVAERAEAAPLIGARDGAGGHGRAVSVVLRPSA